MISLTDILIVGAGSCLGGMARYGLSAMVGSRISSAFPWGTLAVNLLGSLAIGVIYGFIDRGFSLGDGMKLFLTVGFCGGFTTFSTFMHENYLLFASPHPVMVAAYAGVSIIAGLSLVYLGYLIARL